MPRNERRRRPRIVLSTKDIENQMSVRKRLRGCRVLEDESMTNATVSLCLLKCQCTYRIRLRLVPKKRMSVCRRIHVLTQRYGGLLSLDAWSRTGADVKKQCRLRTAYLWLMPVLRTAPKDQYITCGRLLSHRCWRAVGDSVRELHAFGTTTSNRIVARIAAVLHTLQQPSSNPPARMGRLWSSILSKSYPQADGVCRDYPPSTQIFAFWLLILLNERGANPNLAIQFECQYRPRS